MQALGLGEQCIVPELPADPRQVMSILEEILEGLPNHRACLVGSSLGGFYAAWLAERHGLRAVLLNPAIRPYELLRDYLGENENPYTGERYRIDESSIDVLKSYEVERPSRPGDFLVYLETGDEVLDYRQAVDRFSASHLEIFQGGSHEMVNFEARIDDILDYCGCHRDLSETD
jgi:predicted esterase YcpF (UPF0227 family)